MFSKLSAASLCVCNNSAVLTTTTRMIDTQINRETAITGCVVREKQDKMAPSTANNAREEVARVNILNMATRQDINCNTPAEKQQQQLNRVMSAPNGNCNSKRSPKSLDIRKEEVMAIRNRFPTKVPIIVQRFCKETALPQLDKSKYLVPQEITMSQFLTIIRNRMRISSNQTLYLLVNNRSMISLSLTLAEVYNEYAGTDGFLYVTYASQEVFGAGSRDEKQEIP